MHSLNYMVESTLFFISALKGDIYIYIYFSSCIFIVGLKVSAWAPTKRTNINLRHLSTCLICGQFVYNYHFIAIIFSSCHISILLSRLDLSFKSNLIVFSKKKKKIIIILWYYLKKVIGMVNF